jgi:serine/threonine protein kinase
MDQKVNCPRCNLGFNASEISPGQPIQCPGCFAIVDMETALAPIEINGYQVLEMIGQGGMGQVFRALSPQGMPVAMKVMSQELMESDELQERFKREMKIMAALNHPNVVSVFDQGETGELLYFVMEFVEGDTLRNVMRRGPLPEPEIIRTSLETLEALGYAHSKGIIHRDIKPENIMFDKQQRIKVTDFGLARKDSWGSGDRNSLTQAGAYLGTESYMSPEQKVSPKNVTHKSDIYSFGVVLYEMLTDGSLPMGVFQPPTFFKPVREAWDGIIFRLLDINPEMRPQNCQEIIQELKAFSLPDAVSELSAQEPAIRPPKPGSPPGVRKPDPEDSMAREKKRVDGEYQRIMTNAQEQGEAGNHQNALTLWEQALHMASDADDRQAIHQWMEICRDRVREAESGPRLTFLCPHCRKPFQKFADEHIPKDFSCPLCRGELSYDSLRKRISARPGNTNVTAAIPGHPGNVPGSISSAASRDGMEKKPVLADSSPVSGPTGIFAAGYDPILVLLFVALAVDWFSPDIVNGFFGSVLMLFRPPADIGPVPNEANFFRLFLAGGLFFLVFRSIVRMVTWYRSHGN